MYSRYLGILIIVLAAFTLYACSGGGGGGATATGAATVNLTDAPGDYDHVYVTAQNIWFHTDDTAGPDDAGWQKYPLVTPVTVDLIVLSNGMLRPIWNNIALPVGNYQQIRLVLAGTEDALADSAKTAKSGTSLKYNNEVMIGANEYPLRIPDPHHGIRLAGTFQITNGGMLKLAIDVDAGHDVVDILRNGSTEYILKPRLAYCDLDDAGAIVGSIDTLASAQTSTAHFVIKAEQVNDPSNPSYHVIKRWTSVNPLTGEFVLYPLKPGTYDIILRGLGYQTVIAKGVPVTRGTTPTITPTLISMITMTTASTPDYTVDATIASPTGAWINFYQTLPGVGELPYEIRFRHFNPITGQFTGFKLSADPVWVGTYSGGAISGLTTTTPQEGLGGFSAVADAILYDRMAASQLVSSGTTTVSFTTPLTPTAPAVSRSISGTIKLPPMNMMTNGILFAVHDGMIVNTMSVSGQMSGGVSGAYTMDNLPGGSSTTPLPEAFYGVEALGWSTTTIGIGLPRVADLRVSNDTNVDMLMMMLP